MGDIWHHIFDRIGKGNKVSILSFFGNGHQYISLTLGTAKVTAFSSITISGITYCLITIQMYLSRFFYIIRFWIHPIVFAHAGNIVISRYPLVFVNLKIHAPQCIYHIDHGIKIYHRIVVNLNMIIFFQCLNRQLWTAIRTGSIQLTYSHSRNVCIQISQE